MLRVLESIPPHLIIEENFAMYFSVGRAFGVGLQPLAVDMFLKCVFFCW